MTSPPLTSLSSVSLGIGDKVLSVEVMHTEAVEDSASSGV